MHKLRTWGTVTCYLLMNCATSLLCSYCRELRLGVVRRWCGLDNFTGVSFFFLVVDEAIKRLLALCFRTSQECACVTVPAAEMGCFRF